jgi:hypothetical protein
MRKLLSYAAPMANQIIDIREKTQEIRRQPGSHVAHRERVMPEPSEGFDGVERLET